MTYDFSKLQQKTKETEEWLKAEYFTIRSGRATPAVLDGVKVDSYGVLVSLNQVANITVEDARTLRILAFDPSQGKEIEKAISKGDTGLSISADDKGVRVSFPELTHENREQLKKVVKEKLEQARISLRSERDDVWSGIQKKEKDGDISEDEKFGYKEEMEKIIGDSNEVLDDLTERKEEELMN